MPHNKPIKEVLDSYSVTPEQGLTLEQAEKRLYEVGPNLLSEKKKRSLFMKFIDQFKDVMIIILLIAAVISFVIACVENTGEGYFEPILILAIVVANAIMGVVQENKAEKALDALKGLSAPHARVIRDGTQQIIDASDLVPGDIIKLEAGDFIPTDARLIESAALQSEESALTGESVPSDKDASEVVAKDAPLGDRKNMVFSGCSITYGRATAVVTATGMDTEMGKIADLLHNEEDGSTPLQQKLAQLGKYLGFVAIAACAVVFLVGWLSPNMTIMEAFMTSVSLAVSAIPEGLPAIVTIVLAIGVQRMVKRNAIIRSLPAVETLGSASVICSDKTGTLTQNRMTLTHAYVDGGGVCEISDENSGAVRRMLKYATLCCDGTVSKDADGNDILIGDPTETAIVSATIRNGFAQDDLNRDYPRLGEIPFDSDRKMMTTINSIDGKNIAIVKGAFDSIAPRCTTGDMKKASEITDAMSRDALRVIAVACRILDKVPANPASDEVERDLTFLGLVGMIDPPREEVADAVALCRGAGIRPVMITGDHVVTASAIAKRIGIMEEGDRAITGQELNQMSDEELAAQVHDISVYARVSPTDKIRIVKAWQSHDDIVAMTGDGVNDAPALKAADIGCAMGITGTDVAKGASDMTLTDDNFATIVKAVEEGRGIYDNIRKVVGFLLGTNIAEMLTVFFITLICQVSPLLSMQLLWINLVTDGLPAVALGMDDVDSDVMTRAPKAKNEGIFAGGMGMRIVVQGVIFSVLTMIAFFIGKATSLEAGRTMAFITLAMTQCFHAYTMRTDRSLLSINLLGNKKLNGAFLLSVALMAIVALVPPIANIFGLIALPFGYYILALALAFLPVIIIELFKRFHLLSYKSI